MRGFNASTPTSRSLPVIRAMYSALAAAGYDGRGDVLEPAAGIGHFIGAGPPQQRVTAVELDSVTAGIARLLYPESEIHNLGYQAFAAGDGSRSYDIVIGNPPFGNYGVHDPRHRDLNSLSIHNYFVAKSIRALRPGGMAAFVISRYFMDSFDGAARLKVFDDADLVAGVRLPDTAFLRNAGTEVVADVLIFRRRRADEPKPEEPDWIDARSVEVDPEFPEETAFINRFFIDHPERVLGRQAMDGRHFAGASYTVHADDLNADDQQGVGTRLIQGLAPQIWPGLYNPEDGDRARITADDPELVESLQLSPHLDRVGGLMVRENDDGEQVVYRLDRQAAGIHVAPAAFRSDRDRDRTIGLLAIRDSLRELLELEWTADSRPETLAEAREELNRRLDAFLDRYCKGSADYNSTYNQRMLRDEPDGALVLSLYDDKEQTRATILHRRVYHARPDAARPRTAEEAAVLSFAETGSLSLPFCAERLGRPEAEIEAYLLNEGLLFRDPGNGNVVWHEEYLSGNVRHKLELAERASERDSGFLVNVERLRAVLPEEIGPEAIHVSLESPWVNPQFYCDFFHELTGVRVTARRDGPRQEVQFQRASWAEQDDNLEYHQADIRMSQVFGTPRRNALAILRGLANARPLIVYDEDPDGRQRVNGAETAKVRLKAEDMQGRFADWIWNDADRAQELTETFNERYNSHVVREFDGSLLRFPGMATGEITLRQNQRDAAFRMIVEPAALIDHVVGAGKTFSALAASQEQRRMGIAQKVLVAVPRHLLGPWETEAQRLYPGLKVLTLQDGRFTRRTRRDFLARIAVQDWDLILCSHSALKIIPNQPASEAAVLREQMDQLDQLMTSADNDVDGYDVPLHDGALFHQEHGEGQVQAAKEDGRHLRQADRRGHAALGGTRHRFVDHRRGPRVQEPGL